MSLDQGRFTDACRAMGKSAGKSPPLFRTHVRLARALPTISKTKADDAGALLRGWMVGTGKTEDLDRPEFVHALSCLSVWRSDHDPSMMAATVEVAKALPEGARTQPAARLKRADAIVYKLVRFPTMRLSQMEDIGGCRARLGTQARVDGVLTRLLERWPDAALDDYVADPKPTGYRAKHLVVDERGWAVEIQLRTRRQNRWADEVERWADRLGYELKDGKGPEDVLRYFETAARVLAVQDEGGTPDDALEQDLADLREKVRPVFRSRRS